MTMPEHNYILCVQQQITFNADKQTKRTKFDIAGRTYGEIKPGASIKWIEELSFIPPLPPTNLGGGCKHIEVKYVIMVTYSFCTAKVNTDIKIKCTVESLKTIIHDYCYYYTYTLLKLDPK